MLSGLKRLLAWCLIALVQVYRWTLSPMLHALFPGSGCRFHPTCSAYAIEALRTHGPFRGLYWAVRRLARCHPWSDGGHDPVPPAAGPCHRNKSGCGGSEGTA